MKYFSTDNKSQQSQNDSVTKLKNRVFLTLTLATDNIYIERLKQGDEKCLQEIYQLHRRDFTEWAERKFSLDAEEARDIFQDTLITFYENVVSGRLDNLTSSLRTYLFAIGKHKILRTKKKLPLYANVDELPDINLTENNHNELELEAEQQALVHQALSKLGPDCQKILELFYFRELNMVTIAEQMHYKNDNVAKVKKASCMRKLAGIFRAR